MSVYGRISYRLPVPLGVPKEIPESHKPFYPAPKGHIPVQVHVHYVDYEPEWKAGMAEAWTQEHVQVTLNWTIQYLTTSITLWVPAAWVKRR